MTPSSQVIERLAAYFRRNGYVRRIDPVRRAQEGPRSYKKGTEIRLVAQSKAELTEIRQLLKQAGFKPGRPFSKVRQWRQPVYGSAEVARFLSLVGETEQAQTVLLSGRRRGRPPKRTAPDAESGG